MEMLREYDIIEFSHAELDDLTSNFSQANLIGEAQFGKVYRGKTQQGQDVTVKIWEDLGKFAVGRDEHRSQLAKECIFLMESSVNHHPSLVKLLGYCCEDSLLGVVYDLKPVDTVHNLIDNDGFSWLHRIKVAIDIAHLLEFLHYHHKPQYLVRNISSAHIMVDQDYNPVLFDFCMLVGGLFGDVQPIAHKFVLGAPGYTDPMIINFAGKWWKVHDIFSFGTVLLELISKRPSEMKKPVHYWAEAQYNLNKPKKSLFGCFALSKKFSLVHKSFEEDLGFSQHDGYKITDLAMRSVEGNGVRPSMKEVVQTLARLHAVCRHGHRVY
ncbi:serine/threonine-protein kinase CDG1-like isoform X1 [Cornus florida]|uniref:serine/threonine-protein kinase CDG1-like isoform X1 n=1 Tax=Cornus florida TaxID=4283 RepID=UPI0028969359|nr:serine/threonine-protein kinase CDG1-like isoform X1 [Cornus florida]